MKLAICIVHNRDRHRLCDELVKAGYKFTISDSIGGFLREANCTFMIGTEESEIPALLQVIESSCHQREQIVNFMPLEASPAGAMITSPVQVPVGGAIIFVVDVNSFHRF